MRNKAQMKTGALAALMLGAMVGTALAQQGVPPGTPGTITRPNVNGVPTTMPRAETMEACIANSRTLGYTDFQARDWCSKNFRPSR